MIFALARDVVPLGDSAGKSATDDPDCEGDTGTDIAPALAEAGQVRLRDCKRPRPLVLRANVGDVLVVRISNRLQQPPAPDFSSGMCGGQMTGDHARELVRPELSRGDEGRVSHGEVTCSQGASAGPAAPDYNWPNTRNVNFVVQGLLPLAVNDEISMGCLGTDSVGPDNPLICAYRVGQEGTHFFASNAAASGGEGDGGSIVHGLFGAILAERPGTRWYRSQVSEAALNGAWNVGTPGAGAPRHARTEELDYEKLDPASGVPYLNLAQALDRPQEAFATAERVELVHGDLNAIIYCDETMEKANTIAGGGPLGCNVTTADASGGAAPNPGTHEPDIRAFREFSVFFHDELKTFYTRNFTELGSFGQLAGVRDGFAINYGASGMGSLLLANRKGIGPAAACVECLYEEFFLTSWANGDPALLEWFDDDPSNVHHSYLNDPVVFRNFHAGPKETHVFHLHAHQWFAGNDPGRGSYLDSQTVGPQQGFTYNIYTGGRDGRPGKWAVGGSGNRNRTVGDSIFHCHLYPHFAQGMWALWRVHDVLEDGTRKLPDGQKQAGLSTYIRTPDEAKMIRAGSVDPETGAWLDENEGTPIPALVPLPGEPMPPLPTYAPGPGDSAALAPGRDPRALPGRFGSRRSAQSAAPQSGPERLWRAQMPAAAPSEATPEAAAEATPPGSLPVDGVADAAQMPAAAPSEATTEAAAEATPPGSLPVDGVADAAQMPAAAPSEATTEAAAEATPPGSLPVDGVADAAMPAAAPSEATPEAAAEATPPGSLPVDGVADAAQMPAAAPSEATPEAAAEATPPGSLPVDGVADAAMPGYPFYIAGQGGHRPPQAPLDIARDADGKLLSGGLGRHVVLGAERELGITLPEAAVADDKRLSQGLDPPGGRDATIERELEHLRAQIVAKAAAMGDMTAHLHDARILTLPPDGTALEKAAMDFHHDGGKLRIINPDGNPGDIVTGGYRLDLAPLPGVAASPSEDTGRYEVNGSPPRPGAPFADPCGVAPTAANPVLRDPLIAEAIAEAGGEPDPRLFFAHDPKLMGFRRYEGSAVQLDMVVNKAGWHDPQARINVLTAKSDTYKDEYKIGEEQRKNLGITSPRISDQDEPFFFRALSGECIEFRHTNELPKELALDDFQVRTPTDTVGQHIHLVKFDVTASDGSGNGWNYEDGTLAADEIMARRCAVKESGFTAYDAQQARLADWGTRVPLAGECDALKGGEIWRKPLKDETKLDTGATLKNRDLFQTTTQRWFADPILTRDGAGNEIDRTMRTVFSHDHFGPSSIQQHGFYTALLIEPQGDPAKQKVCPYRPEGQCTPLLSSKDAVQESSEELVGASKLIDMGKHDPLHPNYREYALAIADFALLYDPRDRSDPPPATGAPAAAWGASEDSPKGVATLYCEADFGTRDDAAGMAAACGAALSFDAGSYAAAAEDVPPAWVVAKRPGDVLEHRADFAHSLFLRAGDKGADGQPVEKSDADILHEQLVRHRVAAAFPVNTEKQTAIEAKDWAKLAGDLAKPVAGPARPESISVDHHDPYLVNYRMAAVPLRLGTKDPDGQADLDCGLYAMSPPGEAGDDSEVVKELLKGGMGHCSFRYQLAGAAGDAAFAFSSRDPVPNNAGEHVFRADRDPETPILEAYQDDRLVFRLIQGAQEVQHVFNIAGLPFRRNIDQSYPRAMRPLASFAPPPREQCFSALTRTYPEQYEDWLRGRIRSLGDLTPTAAQAILDDPTNTDAERENRWYAFGQAIARCDNLEGMVFAQEVGISEHFEMRGQLRQDVNYASESLMAMTGNDSGEAGRGHVGNPQVSDYLYNFGTVDSLWNGDWGLVRIYRDQEVRDPRQAALGTDAPSISARLRKLDQYDPVVVAGAPGPTESSSDFGPSRAISSVGLPTCPMPRPGRDLRYSYGYVVALRTFDLYSDTTDRQRGTPYGMGQFDRNGQMLALLPDLPDPPKGTSWGEIERETVLRAVRAQYNRPEPFVMRVNAGDCVVLRFINTLTEIEGRGSGGVDLLGDALLPPITPLNADPAAHIDAGEFPTAGKLIATTSPDTGLRPSARLALSIGLPGGAALAELPLGFGLNAAPMEAAQANMASISPEFSFYAGRAAFGGWREKPGSRIPVLQQCVVVGSPLSNQLDNCVSATLLDRLPVLAQQYGLRGDVVLALEVHKNGNGAERVTGDHTYKAGTVTKVLRIIHDDTAQAWQVMAVPADPAAPITNPFPLIEGSDDIATLLCPAGMAPGDCRSALTAFAWAISAEAVQTHLLLSDSLLHWIPYAYGPVPVRVTGDMISQPVHGMFGIIDVLPQQWDLRDPGKPVKKEPSAHSTADVTAAVIEMLGLPSGQQPGSEMIRQISAPQGFGQAQTFTGSLSPKEDDSKVRLREFVLFYQDGLNLRDVKSRMVWRDAQDRQINFQHGVPVPDCFVCDDSYDLGEQGVSYRSAGYVPRLRDLGAAGPAGVGQPERHHNLNAWTFPPDFFSRTGDKGQMPLTLQACQGEQVVIRVVHPGGRARQRTFVMHGLGYDDLFPGFGFPNSALLAPGKSVSAWLTSREFRADGKPVSFLWSDGPMTLASGGTWGLLEMLPEGPETNERIACPAEDS